MVEIQTTLIPVILSGGAGTRLWPVSRKAHPKPFMRMADGRSLAMHTCDRALRVSDNGHILTVTSRDYYFLTRDAYLESLVESRQANSDKSGAPQASYDFLLEPCGRNTAPAIAMAALQLQAQFGATTQMLVMPADHLIRDQNAFVKAVDSARQLAADEQLVTFGIHPTEPETGYGYIRVGEANMYGYQVDAFVEKPDLETAKGYLADGRYRWNAGIFCFRCDSYLQALKKYQPELYTGCVNLWENLENQTSPLEIPLAEFEALASISVDYAVMEKADNVSVVDGDFGWSDIGSWKAISELYESDGAGNRLRGHAKMVDSRNCFVQSEERLVAAVGVDDLVIVDTGDAVLVARSDRAQEVKQVVNQLTTEDHEAAIYHRTVYRPWGSYTVLEDAEDCKVKRLVVKPGQILSLQRHQHRSEHWTVVNGVAKVRVGDKETLLEANQSIWIPVNTLHRLENPGGTDCHLIEVQTGSYFGEDDIERFEDVYGRV